MLILLLTTNKMWFTNTKFHFETLWDQFNTTYQRKKVFNIRKKDQNSINTSFQQKDAFQYKDYSLNARIKWICMEKYDTWTPTNNETLCLIVQDIYQINRFLKNIINSEFLFTLCSPSVHLLVVLHKDHEIDHAYHSRDENWLVKKTGNRPVVNTGMPICP